MFSGKKVLEEHKEVCLKISGEQTVKLRSGSIKFKNCFKQLAVPFTIYADFECNVKELGVVLEVITLYALKKIKIIFAVLLTKFFVLMINLANQLFFTEEKMHFIDFSKQFLKSMIIAKKK